MIFKAQAMVAKNKRLIGIVLAICLILLVPFFAMFVSDEVNWTPLDFFVAAILLFGTGIGVEFTLRKVKKFDYQIFLVIGMLILLILFWMELAVGIFGTPLAGT